MLPVRTPTYHQMLMKHECSALCLLSVSDDEKSKQVAMMGGVYNAAEKVNAWLGEDTEPSDHSFDVLKEYQVRRASAVITSHLGAAEQLSAHRQLFRATFEDISVHSPGQHSMDDEMSHEEVHWLCPLYGCRYWSCV